MKLTPLAQGTGTPAGASVGQERMPQDRIQAAKLVAEGKSPMRQTESDTPVDPQVEKARLSIRKIKMRTQASPDRPADAAPVETVAETTQPVAEVPQESATLDATEQANTGSEETKPLSPQFAALARQKRALQVKERELAEREAKLTPPNMEEYVSKADLQSNPLKVFEAGVTYDQLTEAILSNQSGNNPEIQELRKELKALKEGVDKNLSDRDAQAEQQVLSEMTKQANALVATGDEYELVRAQGYVPQAIDLIHKTWKQTGEILDVSEALSLVENELIVEATKLAQLKKVQSKLAPEPLQPQQQPQQMRTLTNRDGAMRPMSKRDRAIAAMNGTLRK